MYPDILMDHYRHPRNHPPRPGGAYSHTSDLDNPSCGDKIQIMATIADGVVTDIAWDGIGCALSTGSASLMTEYVKGKRVTDILAMTRDDVLREIEMEVSPVRLKCALIPLEAIQKAVGSST